MRPYVGLRPTTPQKAAGWRTEPPVSVPSAAAASSAPTAAADHALAGPRVTRRPEGRVLGGRAHRELVHVCLAEHDRAGGAEPRHRGGVVGRHEPLEDLRSTGGDDALGAEHVLVR